MQYLGIGYYYYFYDWEVQEAPMLCYSARVPVIADIVTGISTINGTSGVSIYPNPVNDKLNIKLLQPANGSLIIKVSDLTGRIVQHNSFSVNAYGSFEMNMKELAKGTYLVKFITDKDEVVQRIVIE